MKALLNNLPGPDDIERCELPNGITLLIRENPLSPSVVLRGCLPCGSFLDPIDKTGLAHFTARSLMNGTQRHSMSKIYEAIESCGAALGFGADIDYLRIQGRALAEDLPMLLSLMLEALDEPIFPADKVEICRHQMLVADELRRNDTGDMAELIFNRTLFGGHPYGREPGGVRETIQAITREDLIHFHADHFGPQNMTLCLVGGIDAQKARETVISILGDWQKTRQKEPAKLTIPPINKPDLPKRIDHEIPQKTESDLIVGTLGPKRKDPSFYSAVLGNCILGEFGMMGRIGQIVRDENGLAYYAGSSLNCLPAGGSWAVSAGVNPANMGKALDLIHQELVRFTQSPVEAEELSDVKSYYIGSLPLSIESNDGLAGAIMSMEINQLGLDHLRTLPEKVDRVTCEAILETAQNWLDPDSMLTVTAGSNGEN